MPWCRRGGLTSPRTRHPHRTRICHQINTMSSRRFLPSSPSCDLFLALSPLHFSLRLRSLSLPLSFYAVSSRSSPEFAPFSRQYPLFPSGALLFLLFFFFFFFLFVVPRHSLPCSSDGDGRWLQPCMMLSLKVTRSRQYFVCPALRSFLLPARLIVALLFHVLHGRNDISLTFCL